MNFMRLTMQAILAIGIMAILFISPVQATCFISATADNSQVSWGDTITFMGSAECSSEVTFRLKDGPGVPAAGILLGTTSPSDGTYEFGWDTGTTKQEYSLAGGQYTVYITSEPDGQYTRVGVLLSSDTESPQQATNAGSTPQTTCFISAQSDNSQVSWGDTITFTGSAECSREVTFRLKDGPGLPAAGILLGTTSPSDGLYEFAWDTGTTKQEYSLAGGQYTVYITSEPDGQYTRVGVLLSSDTGNTPEETEMQSPAETETTETISPAMTEMKTTRTMPPTLTRTETPKIPSPAMTEVTQTSTKNPTIVPTQTIQGMTTPSAVPNDVISQVVNFFKSLFGFK